MKTSLRTLLKGIIDYAGLFPPAALDLDGAIRSYATYRRQPEAWMLALFICPVAKLAALKPYDQELFTNHLPFGFSVLGRGGESVDAFAANLASDLTAMREFVDSYRIFPLDLPLASRVAVESFEVKLPPAVLATRDAAALRGLLDRMDDPFKNAGFADAARFVEPTLTDDWRPTVDCVVHALAAHNYGDAALSLDSGGLADSGDDAAGLQAIVAPFWRTGFKLRTGGLEPAAFPSPELVAYVIEQCRNHNLPLKFTAGLHHPLRRFDPAVRTMMHGFLNLFCASVLAHAMAFDRHDIQAVIEETDARNFEFTDDSIRWNDAEAMLDEIRFVRTDRCLSFGSCSFDDPRDDLKAMRLL